ncbi:P-loop containing nucleoside triphosphate hydrolase protein [Catenaria anguillulae PL171]|uniref:p-loop containing nucleoside triphosphate hydrolase protein n=1 Tax=Catenaria anguillulae PL171 TaxID=765915 RepID=A0A1Y2HFK6_9FUNG|nr:P-loop containing nucleoside triphosphate hydrolase protein [Catenaria anguillulae PL171]
MIDNPAEAAAFEQRIKQQQATLPIANVAPAKLRPYQEECIAKCIEALTERGVKKQAVSLPVGSGKTVVFANLLQKVPDPKPGASKVLVLAHRKELLDQARNQIRRAAPHLRVGMDGGGEKEPKDLSAFDVIVASVPALGSSRSKRLFKYDVNEFKLIIIDEAHHAAAQTYIRILDHFGVWNEDSHMMVWGCSATLRRMDALSLGQVFNEVVYERGFLEMIQDGHLCDFTLKTLCTSTDLSHVSSHSGDYALGALADTINTPDRNAAIVDGWLKASAAADHGGAPRRLSTLVFAATIEHVEELCAAFQARGVDARYLHSRSTADFAARRELVEEFRQGKFPVLVNCGILTEGTDIPNIDCIILARPTRSGILYQQMLGRGLRLHHAKSDCLVIDVVDLHIKADLVTVPSLLGLDPRFVVHDSATSFTHLANIAGKVIADGLAHQVMSESEARDIAEREELGDKGDGALVVDPMQYLELASDVMCAPLPGADGRGGGALAEGESGAELLHVGDAAALVARDMLKRAAGGIDAADLSRIRTRNNWFFIKAGVLGLQLPNQELLMVDCTACTAPCN